jgi:hypothetical protein
MSGGQLNANTEQYLEAAAMNTLPPTIVSDPLVAGATPIELLLRVLGIAANQGDSADNAKSAELHAQRDAKTTEAAAKFAAEDEAAAAELEGIAGDPFTAAEGSAGGTDQAAAMAQQLPQIASGIAGALAGAVGGALQPLAQLPQQVAQGMQQAMQAGMGLFQQAAGDAGVSLDDAVLDAAPMDEDFAVGGTDPGGLGEGDPAAGDLGSVGGGGGLGVPGGTAPTAYLGPPPVPAASTAPSALPLTPVNPPAAGPATHISGPGMAGMPMVPPGAMGANANADKEAKTDTKRVSVPPVRNGAPVQGRLTTPPPTPPVMIKKADGQPLVTRRIIGPTHGQPGDTKAGS